MEYLKAKVMIALTLGYEVIFVVCILVQLIALGVMIGFVSEPRSLNVVLTTDEDES